MLRFFRCVAARTVQGAASRARGCALAAAFLAIQLFVSGPNGLIAATRTPMLDTDSRWSVDFNPPGVDGEVLAFAIHEGDLIVAGRFTTAGGTHVNRIARWDGSLWHSLGDGFDEWVQALVVYEGELIAGGGFTRSGDLPIQGIARWDGSRWQPLSEGLNAPVNALAVHGGRLVVGGKFTHAGTLEASKIAIWDGTTWHAIGGVTQPVDGGNDVRALSTYADELIVAGGFLEIDGVPARYIARWDGLGWHPLGAGLDRPVEALATFDDQLMAGGSFSTAGTSAARAVAAWDGRTWSALADGIAASYPTTLAITSHAGRLIAAGSFIDPNQDPPNVIESWDGHSWNRVGGGMGGGVSVHALIEYQGRLHAGGSFTDADGKVVNRLAVFDGTEWRPLSTGHGMDGPILAATRFAGEIIVGGAFTRAGSGRARAVARWLGDDWEPLGNGLRGFVRSLETYDGELIAAGSFSTPEGEPANVARWTGTDWLPLGGGVDGFVRDLAAYQDNLYAIGEFTPAGATATAHIASWDGSSWTGLDVMLGIDFGRASFRALTVYQDLLIAAGRFTQVDDIRAHNIVSWNGSVWRPLNLGLDEVVEDVQVIDNDLYVTGFFNFADIEYAPQVARWDGFKWHAVGYGLEFDDVVVVDAVLRLGSFRGDLVLGGRFDGIDGIRARNIARWNGNQWETFGSGTDGPALAFLQDGQELFVGGDFQQAGMHSSSFVALWNDTSVPVHVQDFTAISRNGEVLLQWKLPPESQRAVRSVGILRATSADGPFVELPGSPLHPEREMRFEDPVSGGAQTLWYRLSLEVLDGSDVLVGPFRVEVQASLPTQLEPPIVPVDGQPIQIRYSIGSDLADVQLSLYDIRGRLVRSLARGSHPTGVYVLTWNRLSNAGTRVAHGVYFLQLRAGATRASRKLVLSRP